MQLCHVDVDIDVVSEQPTRTPIFRVGRVESIMTT